MTEDVSFTVTEADGRTTIHAALAAPLRKTATLPGAGDLVMTERAKREMAAHLRHYQSWVADLAIKHAGEYRGLIDV